MCGWDGGTDMSDVDPAVFMKQSVYTSILPGLPGTCKSQGCAGHSCDDWTGPCHTNVYGSGGQQNQNSPSMGTFQGYNPPQAQRPDPDPLHRQSHGQQNQNSPSMGT